MGAHSNLGVYQLSATTIDAARASTSTVDHSQPVNLNQYGVDGRLWLCIRTAVAPTAASADTLSIEFQMDADDGLGDPAGTWYTLFMPLTDAVGAEVDQSDSRLATAGAWIWRAPVPMEMIERHTRLYFNNTTTVGVFAIDAWLNDGPPQSDFDKQVYASNVGNP